MTNSISAANLNSDIAFKAQQKKNAVINPPAQFYKYSIYDELKLGENKFKEILSAVNEPPPGTKMRKTKNLFSKVVTLALVLGGGILAFKKREVISKFFTQACDKIKKTYKK